MKFFLSFLFVVIVFCIKDVVSTQLYELNSTVFAGHRVFGAMILTSIEASSVMIRKHGTNESNIQISDIKKARQLARNRYNHGKDFANKVPFQMNFW